MQLVAYGAQDIYLTGNPQITFFKVVYRRHTNFSMESIKQTFDGTADYGSSVSATISRNGDLVYRMYLEHDAAIQATESPGGSKQDTIATGVDYGSHVMKECELEIGGQKIDKHYGHWHSVYSQLTQFNPSGAVDTLFHRMVGNGAGAEVDAFSGPAPDAEHPGWSTVDDASGDTVLRVKKGKFFIPFYFWFCRNPGLALPLIALQYHEVKVKITFEDIVNLGGTAQGKSSFDTTSATLSTANVISSETKFALWCDYIYLDTDERRRFAQVSHEYLIEQLQYSSLSGKNKYELHLNHPVKELIWSGPRPGTPTVSNSEPRPLEMFERQDISGADKFQLKLNGHDRFKARDYKYFTRTQVWEHHTGYGSLSNGGGGDRPGNDTIAVYSFALKPEEHQPSGTCNFSRIDNAELTMTGTATDLNLYAVNYNVLRIMSGMGGLAYSN